MAGAPRIFGCGAPYDSIQLAERLIEVRDQGEGLDEARKDEVFEPFTQLDSGDGRKAGGTGLGLSITKQIIEAHDGRIDYYRGPVRGTVFAMTLPVQGKAAAA